MKEDLTQAGVCKLCLATKPLRESHFMPAALYPKKRKPSFATRKQIVALDSKDKHIKDYVLCFDCEQRLDQNGESEVLYWVSPKSKTFRLGQRLRVALPRDRNPHDLSELYSGADIGVDTDKFAYFAISVVWRGAVHDWVLPDGSVRPHDTLGELVEPMRRKQRETTGETTGKQRETTGQTGRFLNRERSYAKNISSVHRYSSCCLPQYFPHIAKMNL